MIEDVELFEPSDAGNGERLARRYGQDLRYSHARRRWYVWCRGRWLPDGTGEIDRLAKETARSIFDEAAVAASRGDDDMAGRLAKHATRSLSQRGLRAMVERAQSEPPIPVPAEAFDADPWLLNTPGGTVELKSGRLREHRRKDLLTLSTTVHVDGQALVHGLQGLRVPNCEAWHAFLDRVLPDEEVRQFVQRLIGYSLVGNVSEHVLPIAHGDGANGKSTFVGALQHALGGYAQVAPPTLLLASRDHDGPTPELLRLKGARLVVASETDQGRRLDEALVKQPTGGDRIVARMPYARDFEEFDPTHTVMLVTNHRPQVRGADEGFGGDST